MSHSAAIEKHLRELSRCQKCPKMHKPVVVGRPVSSPIILVGQAPGDKEPVLGRPFAWTAGKTLFRWLDGALGWNEDEARNLIYFAAVCRCFPGKNPKGGDRVPDEQEIASCSTWMDREFRLLQPQLILPVGKLAISRFLEFTSLAEVVGQKWRITHGGREVDVIPLPHPSGASTWHRMEPGKTLLHKALAVLARHPAVKLAKMGQ